MEALPEQLSGERQRSFDPSGRVVKATQVGHRAKIRKMPLKGFAQSN
jgi:hypothetical protein